MTDLPQPAFNFFPLCACRMTIVLLAVFAGLHAVSTADAVAEQKVYYSVHVASFQNLKNANAFVNSLASIGKVVFWKETQVPDKGLFYRVYMGRFAALEAAEAYWDRLKAEGKVSYRGIHQFEGPMGSLSREKSMGGGLVSHSTMDDLEQDKAPLTPVEQPRKPRREAEKSFASPVPNAPSPRKSPVPAVPDQPAVSQTIPAAAPDLDRPAVFRAAPPMDASSGPAPSTPATESRGRFTDNGDGTVTDWKSGLMWIKNGWRVDFFSARTWPEAVEECKQFGFAGYSDWRLPTLSQWRSILDTDYECPALAEPNPFENIIVHMPYWSASSVKTVPVKAYTVTLYAGTVTHQQKSDRAFILPVRVLR